MESLRITFCLGCHAAERNCCPVSPEHMSLEAVVEEPGEAGSSRVLRGAFGLGSGYHFEFGHGPFHAEEYTYMCLYAHPISQPSACSLFPHRAKHPPQTVRAAAQVVQPQMNSCWQLVEGQKHPAGILQRNCHSATDLTGSPEGFIKCLQRMSWELEFTVSLDSKTCGCSKHTV